MTATPTPPEAKLSALTPEQEERVRCAELGIGDPGKDRPWLCALIRSLDRALTVIREDEPRRDEEWRDMMILLEHRRHELGRLSGEIEARDRRITDDERALAGRRAEHFQHLEDKLQLKTALADLRAKLAAREGMERNLKIQLEAASRIIHEEVCNDCEPIDDCSDCAEAFRMAALDSGTPSDKGGA